MAPPLASSSATASFHHTQTDNQQRHQYNFVSSSNVIAREHEHRHTSYRGWMDQQQQHQLQHQTNNLNRQHPHPTFNHSVRSRCQLDHTKTQHGALMSKLHHSATTDPVVHRHRQHDHHQNHHQQKHHPQIMQHPQMFQHQQHATLQPPRQEQLMSDTHHGSFPHDHRSAAPAVPMISSQRSHANNHLVCHSSSYVCNPSSSHYEAPVQPNQQLLEEQLLMTLQEQREVSYRYRNHLSGRSTSRRGRCATGRATAPTLTRTSSHGSQQQPLRNIHSNELAVSRIPSASANRVDCFFEGKNSTTAKREMMEKHNIDGKLVAPAAASEVENNQTAAHVNGVLKSPITMCFERMLGAAEVIAQNPRLCDSTTKATPQSANSAKPHVEDGTRHQQTETPQRVDTAAPKLMRTSHENDNDMEEEEDPRNLKRRLNASISYLDEEDAELLNQQNPFDLVEKDSELQRRVILRMALHRQPQDDGQMRLKLACEPPSKVIHEGFFWRDYPYCEQVLYDNMAEYYNVSSIQRLSKNHQTFNNQLVSSVRQAAATRDCRFDESFDDKKLRDRIRCFYKTHLQNAKKRLVTLQKHSESSEHQQILRVYVRCVRFGISFEESVFMEPDPPAGNAMSFANNNSSSSNVGDMVQQHNHRSRRYKPSKVARVKHSLAQQLKQKQKEEEDFPDVQKKQGNPEQQHPNAKHNKNNNERVLLADIFGDDDSNDEEDAAADNHSESEKRQQEEEENEGRQLKVDESLEIDELDDNFSSND